MDKEILVMGATGKTGKRVAALLQEKGIPVRVGSRTNTPSFDWDQPGQWPSVLAGIQQVYFNFYPDFMAKDALEKIGHYISLAKKSGVQHLVFLSGRGEQQAVEAEQLLRDSGLQWTILRSSWFMQNFSEFYFLDNIMAGQMTIPHPQAAEPFVDLDNLAEVAVETLIQPLHRQQIYELTGPELLTFQQATDQISLAIGRPVAYEEVSMADYKNILSDYQVPEEIIALMQYLFEEVLDGRNASVSNDIEKVLGRRSTNFKQYVEKTIPSGIWNS